MAVLPTNQAITRFGENENRVDIFVNQNGYYTTNEAVPRNVETLPSLLARVEGEIADALESVAYVQLGDYASGITFTTYSQVVRYSGEFYKVKTSVSLPFTTTGTWGTDSTSLVAVGDAVLRQDLASTSSGFGSSLVAYGDTTVKAILDGVITEVTNYAALRAYTGALTKLVAKGHTAANDGGLGIFRVDASDTTSTDNGGTILVGTDGRRWKRDFSGVVNALWFGVVGDGVTNDTTAIGNAITYCSNNKKRLYFPGGKTYSMTSFTISGHYYVDMFSDPANRARFLTTDTAAAAGARQFRFIGPEDVTGLTLAANIKPNERTITLASVSGLSAGMIIRLSSSVLWPYDPRGEYTKGELHEIIAVNSGSNTVSIRDSTRDYYAIADITSIAAWTPNYISVENIIFEMPSAAVGTGGLMFSRSINARVHNCRSFGNDFYQFHNVHGINTQYTQVQTGPAYNVDVGGYGIYDLSNLGTRIDGWVSDGLRGPYDSHTTSTGMCPNRDAIVTNFVIRGGGPAIYPDGASECRGLGMHGPSENIRFVNGFISDVQAGIRVRGKNTLINNVVFSGRMQTLVAMSHGCGLEFTNNTYDSFNYPNKIASLDDIVADSRIIQAFDIGINDDSANNWDFSLPLVIKNNTIIGLNDYFMKLTTSQEVYNLDIQNNNIMTIGGSVDTAYLFYAASNRYIYKSIVKNNRFDPINGYVALHNANVYLGYSATPSIIDRAVEVADRQWVLRIADDAVGKVRFNLTNGVDRPNLWIAGDAGGTKLFNIVKENASLTSWAGSTFSNLVGTATGSSLTGTTGTDGNVTVGLMNTGDFYIENRGGAVRTWRISLAS